MDIINIFVDVHIFHIIYIKESPVEAVRNMWNVDIFQTSIPVLMA